MDSRLFLSLVLRLVNKSKMTAMMAVIPKKTPSVIPTIMGTFDSALMMSVQTPFLSSFPAGHISTQYKKVQFSGVMTFVTLDE